MKIDLHCHTKAVKKGDGKGRNVTPELFKKKILDADIKIVAITNHNHFDKEQYLNLSCVVDGICCVWPGVEIDVLEPNSQRWHLIVVANPKEVECFSDNVNELFSGDNLDECTHTLEEIWGAFSGNDAIYIAHFHKRPSVPEEDGDKLKRLVGEPHRIFMETTNVNSMGIFANYRYNVLVGSDVKNWNQYEISMFPELKLPVDSFEQFCLLAKRDDTVVQTLLNQKESKRIIAHPTKKVDLPITLYQDSNIIFGQKGTGKTEIIKTLYEGMQACGMKCVSYVATEGEEEFKKLLCSKGLSATLSKLHAKTCEEEFAEISGWLDAYPTRFGNYENWKKTEGNNANKQRMKITQALSLLHKPGGDVQKHKDDKKTIDEVLEKVSSISLEDYLPENDVGDFRAILSELKEAIYRKRIDDLIEEQSVRLVNYSIEKIKTIADKNTNSVSKPSTVGFADFVRNRLNLHRCIKSIIHNLNVPEVNEANIIGVIAEKGDMNLNTKYRMLCEASRADEFKIGIRKLKEIVELIVHLEEHVFDVDIAEQIQELNKLLSESSIKDISPFVGCSRQVVDANGEVYNPSTGEKRVLLLQRALSRDADAYFLDEPELGMGNSYVDSIIRPKIVDLAKSHKYVIVATHNANIAVRTLPYTSVYRTHSNGVYQTYIGNPFSDRLVNINNKDDVLNWAEESLKVLEGSRDAFYERKGIYESNNT